MKVPEHVGILPELRHFPGRIRRKFAAVLKNDLGQAPGFAIRIAKLRGDSDGVLVSPKNCEDDVLQAAEPIESAEEAIRLDRTRKQPGYHKLQIPED